MELSALNHIEPYQLTDFEADIFITTLGFESRCTSIARQLENVHCRKIALARSDHIKEFSFRENKAYYTEKSFEIIPVETRVPDVGSIMEDFSGDNINIIFDCTSMSPRWYFEFFRWFGENQDDYVSVTMRIVYTMAAYMDQNQSRKVRKVEEFLSVDTNNKKRKKKKALLMGLGHEKNICETIYKIVKPDLLYLYYTDPPVDKQFVEDIFVNNHALINSTPIRNLIAYPVRNGQSIYQSLIDTILPLRDEYTITLIPQGPKIFSVVTMLLHLGYPDTTISYPVFSKPPATDRYPSGDPVIMDVLFEGEE